MTPPPLSLRGVYGSLRAPTLRDLVFSSKAYLAATLALLVGFNQQLENPYWAVLTIYIVMTPPETGAIRSKAIFRFLGTIGGGMLMMAVTGLFGDQLGILVTATIGIIAGAIFVRQIDRTPANYLWLSGGITAGVVGLTNLMQPVNVFDYATARMGEISLGILIITAVDSLFWPRPMTPDFLKTMADWRGQVRSLMTKTLGPLTDQTAEEKRQQAVRQGLRDLTKAVGVIDAKAVQLPFDIVAKAPRGRHLDLVRRQVVEVIADLAAIEVWAGALRREQVAMDLDRLVDAVTAWVNEDTDNSIASTDGHAARGDMLAAELEAARGGFDPLAGQTAVVRRGLLSRLIVFVRDWADLSLALRAVETGQRLPPRLDQLAKHSKPVRSIDYLGAALDVAPLILSMTFTTLLWYFTAWGSGGGALLFSFIGCVFLIGQGQILSSGVGLITVILTAFGFVFLYQYAILPRVTDFPVLIMALGCAMIPFGLLMTMSMSGMLICVYIFAFLGLQDAYVADFNQSLQTLSASLVGLLIAITCLYVCGYDHARFASRRIVTAVRRDILDLARSKRIPDRTRFLFLAMDRLSLYFVAAEQMAAGGPMPRLGMIDDFGIGLNLLTIRESENVAPIAVRDMTRHLRELVAASYRDRLAGRPDNGKMRFTVEAALVDPRIRESGDEGFIEALTGMHIALADVAGNAATAERS